MQKLRINTATFLLSVFCTIALAVPASADITFVFTEADDGGVIVVGTGSGFTDGDRNTDDWDVSNFMTKYLQPNVPGDMIQADVTTGLFSNVTTGISQAIDTFCVDSDSPVDPSDDLQWETVGALEFVEGDEFLLTIDATFSVDTLAFSDLVLGNHIDLGGSSGDEIFGVTTIMIDDDVSSGFVPPTAHQVFRGIELSGALSDFTESDDTFASYNPGFVIINTEAPVWLIFDANAASATEIQVESNANTPGLEYTVEAFNWANNAFDVIDTQAESFNTDQVATFPIVGADHVDVNGDVRSRIGWRQAGFTITFPWEVRVDQAGWNQ